jgi:hypothetical protein
MSWRTDWHAISGRIASLLDAGHFFAEILKVYASDMYQGASVLMGNATDIFRTLDAFGSRYSAALPEPAARRLREFIQAYRAKFEAAPTGGRDADFQIVQFRLTALRALQSELEFLLADTEAVARSLVDRAFIHLQRAIIADDVTRASWRAAFQTGETACERLGGTHLLLHGIWAFKAYAEGERTDLVLGTRLQLTAQIESAAEALVLTEWKLIRNPTELPSKIEDAFRQAKLYGIEALAGFELRTRRYLVMVSSGRLEMRADRVDSGVVYQCINIAVDPPVPSKKAKT